MFVAEPEVEGKIGVTDDITDPEAGGGAGEFLVYFGAVGGVDRLAVGVEFGDIGGADAVAAKGFEIEAGAGMVEGMAIAEEEGDEDHVGLAGGEVVDADLCADLVAFWDREADMEVTAEPGGGLSFCDELSDFELSVEGGTCAYAESNKE